MDNKIIYSVLCLKENKTMKHYQKDFLKNPMYLCDSCKKPHKISINATDSDYNVNCLECNQQMKREPTLESPTTYNYSCTNEKCRELNKKIQIHRAQI